MRQEGVGLDHDKDASVRHAGGETAHDASHFHRVEFTDHDPRNDEEAQRTGDGEDEDTSDREPRGRGFNRRNGFLPALLEVQIRAESDHGDATADSGNERERSSATPSQQDCGNDGKDESNQTKHYRARVFVHGCARILENLDSVKCDCVDPAELVHHKVKRQDAKRLQTGRM